MGVIKQLQGRQQKLLSLLLQSWLLCDSISSNSWINHEFGKGGEQMAWVITFAICFAVFFAIGIKLFWKKK